MSECRGRPDGVRQPRAARRRARVLRGHPRRPADPARAARDLVERYRRLGIEDANPLNAITEETRAALEAELEHAGLHRHEALDAADRGRGRARARDRRDDGRRPRARAALLARCRSPATATSSRQALAGRAELVVRRELARRARLRRVARRPRARARTRTSSSPRTRSLRESSTKAIRTRSSCSRRRGSSPRRPSVADWSFSYQTESADRRAVAPARHPRPPRRRCTAQGVDAVLVCPVGFVSDHLEIRWDLDVEAAERAAELGLALDRIEMPNADPAFVARARRHRPAGGARYRLRRDVTYARRDPRSRARAAASASTRSPCAR